MRTLNAMVASVVLGLLPVLRVDAQVSLICSLVNPRALVFGAYNPLVSAPLEAQASVDVVCSGTGAGRAQLSLLAGYSGRVHARALQSGRATLLYEVYQDAAHSVLWGDGTAGTSTLALTLRPGLNQRYYMHGRMPAYQNVLPGSYVDVVPIQLNF